MDSRDTEGGPANLGDRPSALKRYSRTLGQTRVTSLGVWSRGYVAVSTGLGHAQAFGNGVRRSQACVG